MSIQVKPCPACESTSYRVHSRWRLQCVACSRLYEKHDIWIVTKEKSDKRKRADKHEKKVAKKIGGKQTIASGSTPIEKGDVKSKHLHVECKTTEKKSFSLKCSDLKKIASQSPSGKIPTFVVQFEHEHNNDNYYIVDEGWFLQLLQLWEVTKV